MTLLLFSVIAFVIIVSGPYLFGSVGRDITAFFLGVFGFAAYPLLVLLAYVSFCLVAGKNFIAGKWLIRGGLVSLAVFLIVHTATASAFMPLGYGGYLKACWRAAGVTAAEGTGGGVLLGIVVYPVQALLSSAGAYVLFGFLTALAVYFFLIATPLRGVLLPSAHRPRREKKSERKEPAETAVRTEGARPYPGGVSFDDLETPARKGIPPQAYGQYEPSAPTVSAPAHGARAASREILYGSDPASNYRNNLIYDRNSYFNTHARGSNVIPADTADFPRGYSEGYTAQAGENGSVPPRRIAEEEPRSQGGYVYRPEGTAGISRRGEPEKPAEPSLSERGFERNTEAPEPEKPAEPSLSERGFERNTDPEPEKPVNYRRTEPEAPVNDYRRTEPEKPAEEPETAARSRESSFRSLFSRPVEERIHIEDPSETSGRFEEPAGESDFRSRFGLGRDRTADNLGRGEESDTFGRDRTADNLGRGEESDTFGRDRTADNLGRGEEPDTFGRDRTADSLGRGEEPDTFGRGNFGDSDDSDMPPSRFAEPDEPEDSRVFRSPLRGSSADLFDGDDSSDTPDTDTDNGAGTDRLPGLTRGRPRTETPEPAPAPAPAPRAHVYRPYVPPRLDRLKDYDKQGFEDAVTEEEKETNARIIVETLAGFKVDAEVVNTKVGPSVTRYDVDIPRHVSVPSVLKRDVEIAMRLHASDGVNMYSNSQVGAISIEVPNRKRAIVGLKSVMSAPEYLESKEGALMFAIGKNVDGDNVCGNIPKMTHILVAGTTNAGKSVCLNAMLVSLICKYSPEDLRLILVDPKRVEFPIYEGLPHLMINEVISDAQKTIAALNWAIKEMERRYELFAKKTREGTGVRNLDEYNAVRNEDEEKFPKIVIVIDELADLMTVAKKDIEERIQRLTQKARAAGIHCVIATQRPSVDVITGVIKGNLPTRIAFRVIQEVDSRTILDEMGAEKLLGNGDMLYRTSGMFNSCRVQGAFISTEEVQGIVEEIKANNEAYFDGSVADYINKPSASNGDEGDSDEGGGEADPQYVKALGICVKLGQASISLIQRKCNVGYNHAGKIIDWMEAKGYITPFDGKAKARDVILTPAEYEEQYGNLD